MKRVIVGGISHETSTFTPIATTLESYQERFLLRGSEILETFRGTNSPVGGYIDGANKYGFELIPTLFAGLESRLGPSAHIEQNGIHVLLTTLREQPFDTAFARSLQLDPRQMRYIGVKSAAHFRAGFESWAGNVIVVSEPSVHNLGHLPYKRLNRQLYPFQDSMIPCHAS